MSEYIVNVPDEEAEYFIARFGFENVKLMGYSLTGEIVRCKDCEYYMDYEHEYEPNLGYCRFHDMQEVRDSRFCAWACRKSE